MIYKNLIQIPKKMWFKMSLIYTWFLFILKHIILIEILPIHSPPCHYFLFLTHYFLNGRIPKIKDSPSLSSHEL